MPKVFRILKTFWSNAYNHTSEEVRKLSLENLLRYEEDQKIIVGELPEINR
jgi:hypothetical protein